jgi:hypothetical protein
MRFSNYGRSVAAQWREDIMINLTRKLALIGGIGLALASVSYTPPAAAQAYVAVGVGVAPPQPRYEVIPPPRRGYVWAPGYWRWSPRWHRHDWVPGHWEAFRPGYRYVPGVWVQGRDGWRYRDGYWGR